MMLKAGLIVLLLGSLIFAQNSPLVIVDTSEGGAPVSLSGTATVQLDPFQAPVQGELQPRLVFHISAKNVSENDILLTVMRIEVLGASQEPLEPSSSHSRSDDWIFASRLFAAHTGNAIEMVDYPPRKQPPAAGVNLELVFVQFADGSTWGDPDEAKASLAEREVCLKELMDLARTYQTEGAAKFASSLTRQPLDPVTYDLKDSYQESGDVAGPMKLLNEKLNNAGTHLEKLRKMAVNQMPATM